MLLNSMKAAVAAKSRTVNDIFNRTVLTTENNAFGRSSTGQVWQGGQQKSTMSVTPELGATVSSSATFAQAYIDMGVADVSNSVRFNALSTDRQGIILRWVDANNFYYVRVATTNIHIMVGTTATGFVSKAIVTRNTVNNETIRAVITGNTILVYSGNNLIVSYADLNNTFMTSTKHGFALRAAASHVNRVILSPVSAQMQGTNSISFRDNFDMDDVSNYRNIFHAETLSYKAGLLPDGRKALKMSVPNTAVGPTVNVRCQMQPPANLGADMEVWMAFAVMFPSGTGVTQGDNPFPTMPGTGTSGWFNVCQVYVSDPEGSAAIKLGMRIGGGQRLYWQRNDRYGNDRPWVGPEFTYDLFYEYAFHVFFSSDPSLGYVELYQNVGNGWVQQTFFEGTQKQTKRLYMLTIDPLVSGNEAMRFDLQSYRKVDLFPGTVDTYYAGHRVGYSLSEVDPGIY